MNSQTRIPPDRSTSNTSLGWALIIDDHPLFCDALELTLGSVASFSEVATSNCLAGALERLESGPPPALILLDLNLPDVSGFQGIMQIKRQAPASPIIVISSMTDNSVIKSAISAGASGFVPKHSSRIVIKEAVDLINEGGVFIPKGFVDETASDENDGSALKRLSTLTAQQTRILELICEGKLNKQIAFDLSIAETTVKAHVTAIMRKLCVHSRTQAVLVAQEAKFSSVLPNSD